MSINKNQRVVKGRKSLFRVGRFFKINYYGFGISICTYLCKNLNITPNVSLEFMQSQNKVELDKKISDFLKKRYNYGLSLKRFNSNRVQFYENLSNFRGWRLKFKLPVNGQNTKSNAKTVRKRK